MRKKNKSLMKKMKKKDKNLKKKRKENNMQIYSLFWPKKMKSILMHLPSSIKMKTLNFKKKQRRKLKKNQKADLKKERISLDRKVKKLEDIKREMIQEIEINNLKEGTQGVFLKIKKEENQDPMIGKGRDPHQKKEINIEGDLLNLMKGIIKNIEEETQDLLLMRKGKKINMDLLLGL